MRRTILVALGSLLTAASALAQPSGQTLGAELQQARAEQAAAEAQAEQLENVAAQDRSEAGRLHAQQAAAAEAIDAAEARITAADMQYRLASAYIAAHRRQLAAQEQPVASLLAGLALMARRPPLLALAGDGSSDDLVKVRILLDATLPVIRARTAQVSTELAQGQKLQQAALAARAETVSSRRALASKRALFAQLEQKAMRQSFAAGGQALTAGDVAIAAGEDLEQLRRDQASATAVRGLAQSLVAEDPAPLAPESGASAGPSPLPYRLPANAPVAEGLGSVNDSGVRARGITLDTPRGAPVTAPAAGVVKFSGPYDHYDGVLIVDHGDGWMSLIVNVASQLKPGERVVLGQPVGRALGPLDVELSRNGHRFSPALIAGSSETLSNAGKGG